MRIDESEAGPALGVDDGSWYAAVRDGRLVLPQAPDRTPAALLELIHDQLRALILSRGFPCVGAKSAVSRGSYRIGLHDEMGSPAATSTLERSLRAFVAEFGQEAPAFNSLIACFTGAGAASEAGFEAALWRQLQRLHDADARISPWSSAVSDDPADPAFSFSAAGQAFFVVGLHPASSRWARRFAWPTLIFNRHDQFVELRADGRYRLLQQATRTRDRVLQGSQNPMLGDFGRRSEARQYSGRAVGEDWICPFQPQPPARTASDDDGDCLPS